MKNFNEKKGFQFQEIKPGEDETGFSLELAKSSEAENIANQLKKIQDAILNNEDLKLGDIQGLGQALDEIEVNIEGDKLTLGQILQIPDLEKEMAIWQEIKEGNYSNRIELTYLPISIAALLKDYQGNLYLNGLKELSPEIAIHFKDYKANLILNGLKELSPEAAMHLKDHQGIIVLNGLKELSLEAARLMSQHKKLLTGGANKDLIKKCRQEQAIK